METSLHSEGLKCRVRLGLVWSLFKAAPRVSSVLLSIEVSPQIVWYAAIGVDHHSPWDRDASPLHNDTHRRGPPPSSSAQHAHTRFVDEHIVS